MSNLNSPNEPIYPPCPKGWPTPCRCDYCASETERIDVAFYGAEAAARAEEARLRTFLKDCDCRCCEARARLAVLSYEIAFYPTATASDPVTLVRGSDEERRAAEAYRIACESRRHPCEIVRAAAQRRYETDTGA